MSKKIDLTGQRFGKLTVIEEVAPLTMPSGKRKTRWRCLCDCGTETLVLSCNLRHKRRPTESCGTGECFVRYGVRGEECPAWRGGVAQYEAAHQLVRRERGKASEHHCVDCGEQAADWSLDYTYADDPTQERHGSLLAYSFDVSRYSPRCKWCHKNRDNSLRSSRTAVEAGRVEVAA